MHKQTVIVLIQNWSNSIKCIIFAKHCETDTFLKGRGRFHNDYTKYLVPVAYFEKVVDMHILTTFFSDLINSYHDIEEKFHHLKVLVDIIFSTVTLTNNQRAKMKVGVLAEVHNTPFTPTCTSLKLCSLPV